MSPQDTTGEPLKEEEFAQDTDHEDTERENDSVASKLSKELNNWRRRRTTSRPKHSDGPNLSYQSESARTIKVRGHETLVIRKPKVSVKPPVNKGQNS